MQWEVRLIGEDVEETFQVTGDKFLEAAGAAQVYVAEKYYYYVLGVEVDIACIELIG
jgi:hypothetical protein